MIIWIVVFGLIVVNLSFVAVIATQCRPLNALWNESVHGKCSAPKVLAGSGYFQGGNRDTFLLDKITGDTLTLF